MKKILIIIYTLIFIALAYYIINLFANRNQDNIEITATKKPEILPDTSTELKSSQSVNIDIESDIPTELTNKQKDAAYTIVQEDCTNECSRFFADTDEKIYCKQVCGLTSVSDNQDCAKLNNLEKDYCLRDYAIAENNIKLCSKIQDTGIQKQCQNRINENFIDEIM